MLIERIDRYLEKVKPLTGKRMMRKFHPSTIGYCERKSVFEMMMLPHAPVSAKIQRVFENGHSFHERFEKMFDEMGILIEAEKIIESDEISGRTDAWIKINSEDFLVELKSASNFSFEWMQKKNEPKIQHVEQLMLYLHLTDINNGIILVENKDTQDLLEFVVRYDPVIAMELMQRVYRRIEYAQKRIAPPIPEGYTPACSECSYCPFSFYCHSESKKFNKKRYPIPFQIGSVVYQQVINTIHAILHEQPIDDFVPGDTNGDLHQYMKQYNHLSTE